MSKEYAAYDDIEEGRPRVSTFDDHGVRTTKTTTKLGVDPNEKPKETVSVRTIDHPDSTETVTVTEKKLPPMRYTETITREKVSKKPAASPIRVVSNNASTTFEEYPPTEMYPPTKTVRH